ncbi:MAG: DUF4012 domain-containing protein [Microgenomates group bacterium]
MSAPLKEPVTNSARVENALATEESLDRPKNSSSNEQTSKLTSLFSKQSKSQKASTQSRTTPWKIALGVVLVLLLLVSTATGVYTYAVARELESQARELEAMGRQTYDSFKAQNLPEASARLNDVDAKFDETRATYERLAYLKYIPVARLYYADGGHGFAAGKAGIRAGKKAIDAIQPYADVLGFTGEGTFEGGTAEDRLKLILETVQKISPILDEITTELTTAEKELLAIDPNRYPEVVKGKEIRSNIIQAQELSTGAVSALTDYRPVIEALPMAAGSNEERKKYLILFQNDNELRPTGGFLTAYAIVNVADGKVEPEKSDDIYELDQKFSERIAIPEALGRYLTTEKYWNLRDMNTSPDFKTSMEQFYQYYQDIPGEPDNIDGIIAVDTHFLTNLLRVLGPVEVPGYGTFSAENDARCDCPQIIYVLSEIITRPTPYLREDRKGILGPLMRATLTKAYTAPKQQWPTLFETGLAAVQARHIQFYFLDETLQSAAETASAAGRLPNAESTANQDFLAIVNANLGGAKSNLFVTYDVLQTVSAPENGKITKTVEITYKNSRKADNCNLEDGLLCLNSTLRDWTRLYVPKGSELVEAQGFNEEAKVYDEAGYTVFDGFFLLEPLGTAKLKITYTVPFDNSDTYTGLFWKQGGIENYNLVIDVTGGQEELLVTGDQLYSTPF